MGSSSGQSGETRYNWNPTMLGYWAGPEGESEKGVLERAARESNRAYNPYGKDEYNASIGNAAYRVAPLSADQNTAIQGVRNVANDGTAFGNTARNTLNDIAQGKQLGKNVNPWSNGAIYQPENEYAGMNSPYFQQQMQTGIGKIVDNYKRGTAADLAKNAAMSKNFGGSAYQDALKNNQSALGEQIGNYATNMQQGQYDRSAQLREGAIGRNVQSQQFDKGVGSQNYENSLARQMQAAGMGQDAEAAAIRNRLALYGMGSDQRAIDQQLRDTAFGDWSQGQNWERGNINWLANLLGQAQGSTGVSQQFGGYGGINPAAGLLGGAALYSSLFGGK